MRYSYTVIGMASIKKGNSNNIRYWQGCREARSSQTLLVGISNGIATLVEKKLEVVFKAIHTLKMFITV